MLKLAEVDEGHIHRLRHAFAVGLLQSGVSLENVSVLLDIGICAPHNGTTAHLPLVGGTHWRAPSSRPGGDA
jgi:hypothetical protein